MNSRVVFLIVVGIIVAGIADASIPFNQYWSKANNFYRQKNYDSAIAYYEKIAITKPANPELYYNLGNAHYRSNNIAQAILNYKRALKFRPGYVNAEDNLQLAQARMAVKPNPSKDIFFIRWWKQLTSPSLAYLWAITALLMFLGVIGFLFWSRWRRVNDVTHRSVVTVGIVVFVGAMIAAFISANKQNSKDEAVVMVPDAVFKSDVKAAKSEMLPEGTIVSCKEQQGEWVAVQLGDGREGWMRVNSVERL